MLVFVLVFITLCILVECVSDIDGTCMNAYTVHLSLQNGWTALMAASQEGQLECVMMLLDRGVQVNMQDMVSGVCVHAILRVSSSGY